MVVRQHKCSSGICTECAKDSIYVFVYGTLRPGGSLFGQIRNHVLRVVPDTIKGDLFMCGGDNAWFPVLREGNGHVTGMILELKKKVYGSRTIHHLDEIEGVSSFLYKRACIKTNSGHLVWVYFGDQIDVGEEIMSGDFFDMYER